MNFHIAKAAVIGAGTMGTGIAALLAAAGVPVCLLDIVPPGLTAEEEKKGLTTESKEFRNRIPALALKQMKNPKTGIAYDTDQCGLVRIGNLDDDLALLSDCDWVVEVIVEKLQVKKDLLKKIEPYLKKNAIVSSNTSGVSITSIVEDMPLEFRRRFLGTHFFNPPRYMRLMELIPGADTASEVCSFMEQFGEHILGKDIVLARDTPNFIANRIGAYASVVNFSLMEKYGFDFETVDQITGREMMRPRSAVFKTIDMVGLDVVSNIAANLREHLKTPEELAVFTLPGYVDNMIGAGLLGNKTKAGFYKTVRTETGKAKLVWDPAKGEYVPLKKQPVALVQEAAKQKTNAGKLKVLIGGGCPESDYAWDVVKSVLLYSAARIPEITDDYRQIDKGMRSGYNWILGPFQIWDAIGVRESVARMKADGETIPQWVLDRLDSGKETFYEAAASGEAENTVIREMKNSALLDLGDGVVAFDIRSRGCAVNFGLMDELQEAIREVNEKPEWKGMVLTNRAANFCNGADLVTIGQLIESGDFDALGQGIDRFHQTSLMLRYAGKPIVAAVHGKVLGGGLEFAMHCHRMVACVDSYMGLVEAGVGLVPGGGGVKELLVRAMDRVKGFGLTDLNPVIQKAWETVATAKVSSSAFEAKKLGFMRSGDPIVMNPDDVNAVAKREVLRMAEDGFHHAVAPEVTVNGTSGKSYLDYIIGNMLSGRMISDYDGEVAGQIAWVITGGNLPKKAVISEKQLMDLEKEAFLKLAHHEKTQARIRHMLETGKPLRN